MKKEIKKYLIAGIAVVCMLLLTSCQDLPNGERPFDYGPAKWVSESGDLWFEVIRKVTDARFWTVRSRWEMKYSNVKWDLI